MAKKKETKKQIVVKETTKKKQLVFSEKLRDEWQKFLGPDYEIKFGQFISREKDNCTCKIYDEVYLQEDNGLLFLEYKNTINDKESTLYEKEWLIQKGIKRIHATNYMKDNLKKFYSKDLELIAIYKD
jgi:5'-deoxynucleotidase YfbR-like HD superfamily hydrolase